MAHTVITPDQPITEAGRFMMADELTTLQSYWPELRLSAEVTAVHETRKAIRRTFTLFKLFTPYFAPEVLQEHQAGLRKLMGHLAPCRDAAVFRLRLAAYNEAAERPLRDLASYWDNRQTKVDGQLRRYLSRKSVIRIIDRYAAFAGTEGAGLPGASEKNAPLLVRHALPTLIFQRMGAVRAWGELLPAATPKQFHQLRIQFKELRYTLNFFEDILTLNAGSIIDLSRRIQDHLGELNDASVASDLLKNVNQPHVEAAIYRGFQQAELSRLTADFLPLYTEFDQPEIRHELAVGVVNL